VGTSDSSGNRIYFDTAGQLFVKDSIFRGNGIAGIYVTPPSGTAQASVDHCRLEQNGYGPISDGLFGGSAKVTIRDRAASGIAHYALIAQDGGQLNAEGCLVTNSGAGSRPTAQAAFFELRTAPSPTTS
jgi:hypothetical protein